MPNKTKQEKEESKYRDLWDSYKKFREDEYRMNILNEVSELTLKIKEEQKVLDKKREELKKSMYKVADKVYDLEYEMMASISEPRSKHYEFDMEKFKSENPELYDRYLVPCYPSTTGRTLTVRKMGEKMIHWFGIFSKEEELNHSNHNKTPISIIDIKSKHTIGDVMTIEDYMNDVKRGYLTLYDGYGKYLDVNGNECEYSSFSVNSIKRVVNKYPYVIWFNK